MGDFSRGSEVVGGEVILKNKIVFAVKIYRIQEKKLKNVHKKKKRQNNQPSISYPIHCQIKFITSNIKIRIFKENVQAA